MELFNESRLSPGVGTPRPPRHEAEVVTYVREGTLAFEEASGRSGVIQAGEFQRMATGPGNHRGEMNASRTAWAHVFQIWLRADVGTLEASREQKRFSTAERRGGLCLIASPDARDGSLRLVSDAFFYSALVDRGQHLVHELPPGRDAWLHVVEGAISLGELVLSTGDGARFTDERSLSLTARTSSEVMLIELGHGRFLPR